MNLFEVNLIHSDELNIKSSLQHNLELLKKTSEIKQQRYGRLHNAVMQL